MTLLWHVVEAGGAVPDLTIRASTLQRAGAFLHRFLFRHSLAFYCGTLGLVDDHDHLTKLAGHILAHGKTELTVRDVQRSGVAMAVLDRPAIVRLAEQLEALGWLLPAPSKQTGTPRWAINPAVHALFRERAGAEARRRAGVRVAIADALGGSTDG